MQNSVFRAHTEPTLQREFVAGWLDKTHTEREREKERERERERVEEARQMRIQDTPRMQRKEEREKKRGRLRVGLEVEER